MSLSIEAAEKIARGGHRVHVFKYDQDGRLIRTTLEPAKAPGAPVQRSERVVPSEPASEEKVQP